MLLKRMLSILIAFALWNFAANDAVFEEKNGAT